MKDAIKKIIEQDIPIEMRPDTRGGQLIGFSIVPKDER